MIKIAAEEETFVCAVVEVHSRGPLPLLPHNDPEIRNLGTHRPRGEGPRCVVIQSNVEHELISAGSHLYLVQFPPEQTPRTYPKLCAYRQTK